MNLVKKFTKFALMFYLHFMSCCCSYIFWKFFILSFWCLWKISQSFGCCCSHRRKKRGNLTCEKRLKFHKVPHARSLWKTSQTILSNKCWQPSKNMLYCIYKGEHNMIQQMGQIIQSIFLIRGVIFIFLISILILIEVILNRLECNNRSTKPRRNKKRYWQLFKNMLYYTYKRR